MFLKEHTVLDNNTMKVEPETVSLFCFFQEITIFVTY